MLDCGAACFNDPVNLGTVFTANTNFSVNALGFYYQSDLTGSETVGLYDSSGTLLTSTTVTLSDPVVNGFLFNSITPVALTSGGQYFVVAFVGDNTWSYSLGTPPTTTSDITYNGWYYKYTSALAFPQVTEGGVGPYFGPNFEIAAASATPLPGALPLFAGGLGIIGLIAGRKKRRSAGPTVA